MSQDILYEKRDRIATITLNRPQAMNALTRDMMDRWLPELWQDVQHDRNVWVAILTAAGDRAFSTGRDLKEAARPDAPKAKHAGLKELRITARQNGVGKPVICAVNGICAGGSLELVVDSDIAICSENATFSNPGVSVGTLVSYPAIRWSRSIPLGALMRMQMTGKHERLSAQRALELGIVTEVAPFERLQAVARELAEKIARNAPSAVRAVKKALLHAAMSGLDETLEYARQLNQAQGQHPDIKEGVQAFAEKREPRWLVE